MQRAEKIVAVLSLLFLVSMYLPESWAESIHFGSIPVGGFIFSALCLALVGQLLRKPAAMSPGLIAAILTLVLTTAWGYLRGNVETYYLKFFGADIFSLGALVAGYALARTQRSDRTTRIVSWNALAAAIAIILTYLALFAGLISTEFRIGGRTVTGSIFIASGVLLTLLPWAAVSMHTRDTAGGWRTWFLFATTAGTGLLSATRSMVIGVVLAAFLYLILKRRKLSAWFFFRLAGGTALLIAILMSNLFGTFVFSRLSNTNIAQESRTTEIELMWPQINDDLVAGQGMGSRFVSNVVIGGNPLASAPHIGILAFILKGGIPLFLWYAVFPLLYAVYVFILPRFQEKQRGAAAAVIMFIATASLSGGWSPTALFAYGLCLASMTPERGLFASPVSQQYGNFYWPSLRPGSEHGALQR